MFELIHEMTSEAVIKVIGIGGCGNNILNHMVKNSHDADFSNVEFFFVDIDAQALRSSVVSNTIQIGANITRRPEEPTPQIGYRAAEEDREALSNMVNGADMVFIVAGMGGTWSTGAVPVITEIAKNEGALTVAIVTKPFNFEGKKRAQLAEQGIKELSKNVDSLIVIENEKLFKVLPKNLELKETFTYGNDVVRNVVLDITDMITKEGLVTVDLADVKRVMLEMGSAMTGTSIAEGEGRAKRAAMEAVASPLFEDIDLSNAKGVLINISAGNDLDVREIDAVVKYVADVVAPDAMIISGSTYNPEMEGQIRVTLVAG